MRYGAYGCSSVHSEWYEPFAGEFGSSAPADSATGGLFGAPARAAAFGQPAPAPAFEAAPASAAGGVFCSTLAPVFGAPDPAFGAAPAPEIGDLFCALTPTAAGGLFSQPAQALAAGGLFGAPAQAASSLFGQPAPAPTAGGLFEAPTPAKPGGVDVGSTQAGELTYGEHVNVCSNRTGHEYAYEYASEPTVLCMSIWENMKLVPLNSTVDYMLQAEMKEWVDNEGKALIASLNTIFKEDRCVIDLKSEAYTIICTCGHQCINHANVSSNLTCCPLYRSPITAFVQADGIVFR